ncbi:MAG: hypothetical protein ACLQJ0_20600 [Steroidobacteraceae bacterium]|jgi:hypothetical protein
MGGQNEFCSTDSDNSPKWSILNALAWKLTPNWRFLHSHGGQEQLFGYKRAWITYNRVRIVSSAGYNYIPSELLGCVVFNEVGGDPPSIKRNVVLPVRQHLPFQRSPMQTSEGAIKIQLRVALSAIGLESMKLDHQQQDELTTCLETDVFNIEVVAKLLYKLIIFDYPNIDTMYLTDEQFVVAGSRYNRGTARPLSEFIQSLNDSPGQADRVYTSYGRAMLRHRDEVEKILKW